LTKHRYYLLAAIGLAWAVLTPHAMWPFAFLLILNIYSIIAERSHKWRGRKIWIA
jgi:hypothetical protein